MRYHEIISEAITAPDTPEFDRWFRGSKVVDKTGKPVVCYHGTFFDFAKFAYKEEASLGLAGSGYNRLGFWFDTKPDTPNYFAGTNPYAENGGSPSDGVVYPCFLNIKKPLVMNSEMLWDEDLDELRRLKAETRRLAYTPGAGHEYEMAKREFDKAYKAVDKAGSYGWYRIMEMLPNGLKSSTAEVAAFQKEIIGEGYDGIYFPDTMADMGSRNYVPTDWWVAFHPNQIKSVFAKEFNPESEHMSEDVDAKSR